MMTLGSLLFPVLLLAATPASGPQPTPNGGAEIPGELKEWQRVMVRRLSNF